MKQDWFERALKRVMTCALKRALILRDQLNRRRSRIGNIGRVYLSRLVAHGSNRASRVRAITCFL